MTDLDKLITEGRELLERDRAYPDLLLGHFARNNLARFMDEIERLQAERDSARGLREGGWTAAAEALEVAKRVGQERDALRAELASLMSTEVGAKPVSEQDSMHKECDALRLENKKLWDFLGEAAETFSCDDPERRFDGETWELVSVSVCGLCPACKFHTALAALPTRDTEEAK